MDLDQNLFLDLKNGDTNAFKLIYDRFWADLYRYAYNILRNQEICEGIVQETFLSLWNKRQHLQISSSLRAYLFTAVKFQTVTQIRALKVRSSYANNFSTFENTLSDNSNEENIRFTDLKKHLEMEVTKLPEKCQLIFRMSRNEHQSIKDISAVLNLSHKTVENQLSKALKQLRSSLGDFLLLSVALLISL
jgi:RNA polymerase sigma-70 factor (family 1)